jgi:hypothetical protein
MINNANIIVAAAIFAASCASSAFAQSYDNTGSVLPYHYEGGKKMWGSWGQQPTDLNRHLEMRPQGHATTPSGGRSSRGHREP